MLQLLIPALLMGLAGSLHCVGMCGPIAMALPLQGRSNIGKITGAMAYNMGRVTTYALFGMVFGLLGRSFEWFGWQQRISIGLGLVILLFLLIPRVFPKMSVHPAIQKYMAGLRKAIATHLFKGDPSSMYATGLLNGLLPCGLVYMALAGAVVSGNLVEGMLFMAVFGLGTIPAMLSISLAGGWLKQPVRVKIRQMYPAILLLMATLLILRGLGLGIPFVSPKLNMSGSVQMDCHPN